jgi:hypothetical protein
MLFKIIRAEQEGHQKSTVYLTGRNENMGNVLHEGAIDVHVTEMLSTAMSARH